MKILLKAAFAYIFIVLLTNDVYAYTSLININFNKTSVTYTGAGVVGTSSDSWNKFNFPSLGFFNGGNAVTLLNSTGHSSGVSITDYSFGNLNYVANSVEAFPSSGARNLMNGYALTYSGSTSYMNLSGLKPGQLYRITVYSQAVNNSPNYELDAHATGSGPTVNFSIYQDNGAESTFVASKNYAQAYVYPTSLGTLALTFTSLAPTQTTYSALNGLQIEAVPEPRNVVLFGVGAAFLAGVRFRNKSKETVTVEL
jgi:hypothetical protein